MIRPSLICLLPLLVLAGGNLRADDDDAPSHEEKVPSVVTVQTGALKLMTLHRYVEGYAMVEPAVAGTNAPSADALLAAPAPGQLVKLDVVEGQEVQKGQVLMQLNSGTITYENAVQQLARQKALYAQQNTSLKNLQDAENQLALLRVVAPISGTAVHINVKPGQAVDVTTVVAEIMDLHRLELVADIPTAQAGELLKGQTVTALTDPPVSAELSYISPAVNTNNDTVAARAALPAESRLRPGQYVAVRIVVGTHTNCLAAPAESVVTADDKTVIAQVQGEEAQQVAVKTGFSEDGWVEVSGPGLKPGSPIVTVGAYGLPEKTKIRVANPAGSDSKTSASSAP
jgi:multidrug efflux pump subunit AcrA (membrane-fusion protein)